MPPIPPRTPSATQDDVLTISQSIDQSTIDLIHALRRLQNDISTFQIPRLRSIAADNTSEVDLATQQHYAAELRGDMEKFARQVEELEIRADDEPRKKDKEEIKRFASDFSKSSADLRRYMRAAIVDSKRAIESRGKTNRDLLLGTLDAKKVTGSNRSGSEKSFKEDALMAESDNVTEALRRTAGQMQQELERSILSVQLLEQSTQTLKQTSATHDTLFSLTQTSKLLIKALERADTMDRLLIIASLVFFFLVVAFILRERVLMRGVRGVRGVGRFVGWGFKGVFGTGGKAAGNQHISSFATNVAKSNLNALKDATQIISASEQVSSSTVESGGFSVLSTMLSSSSESSPAILSSPSATISSAHVEL